MLFVVKLATAQLQEECLNIIETNLNKVVTNVVKIEKCEDKIIVFSERDNKEYVLSISLKDSTEFCKVIKIGARISIQTKDGIKFIYVARKEELGIRVKIFNICV